MEIFFSWDKKYCDILPEIMSLFVKINYLDLIDISYKDISH